MLLISSNINKTFINTWPLPEGMNEELRKAIYGITTGMLVGTAAFHGAEAGILPMKLPFQDRPSIEELTQGQSDELLAKDYQNMSIQEIINDVASFYSEEFGVENAAGFMTRIGNIESRLGTHRNTYRRIGKGWPQIDPIAYKDLQERLRHRPDRVEAIEQRYGFNPLNVNHNDLNKHPLRDLYAAVFQREYLMRFPGNLPRTLEEEASWWKKNYNTYKGAGTVERYLRENRNLI